MSGAMRRIGEYLGLLEDTGRYDEFDDYDDLDAEPTQRQTRVPEARAETVPVQSARARRREATVADLDERRRSAPAGRPTGRPTATVAGLSTITTLHPRTYNEARVVGENFRDGTPVIMNLTEMDDDDAKRLVDFAAGLVFATRGTIERVTAKVFLLSPPNVSVAAEDKQRIAEGGFFNQS
jgi:cell division inhibitor SepF